MSPTSVSSDTTSTTSTVSTNGTDDFLSFNNMVHPVSNHKLDATNYLIWFNQVEPILICYDLFQFCDGTFIAPPIENGFEQIRGFVPYYMPPLYSKLCLLLLAVILLTKYGPLFKQPSVMHLKGMKFNLKMNFNLFAKEIKWLLISLRSLKTYVTN